MPILIVYSYVQHNAKVHRSVLVFVVLLGRVCVCTHYLDDNMSSPFFHSNSQKYSQYA
jgi:hypothetical protein